MAKGKCWYVYIIECADKSLYTGITTDILRRVDEHNSGKGGSYTRSRLPVKLLYKETASDRPQALRRESQIKSLPRNKKQELAAKSF